MASKTKTQSGVIGGVDVKATTTNGKTTYSIGGKDYSSVAEATSALKSAGYDKDKETTYTTSSGKTYSNGLTSKSSSGDSTNTTNTTTTNTNDYKGTTGMDFGSTVYNKGEDANTYMNKRNTLIADKLSSSGAKTVEDVNKWMEQNAGADWSSASQSDRDRTVNDIYSRLTTQEEIPVAKTTEDVETVKPGYLSDGTKVIGYEGMTDEYKGWFDNLPDNEKKRIANYGAEELQNSIKTYVDYQNTIDDYNEQKDLAGKQHDVDMEMWKIQSEQTLRNAEESYNNLKQNRQYLGNMGMPGTSATKIQAIGDSITEAKTIFGEVKKLQSLKKTAKELNWESQVLSYNQKIEQLQKDLDRKVSNEIQTALSKYSIAELEGQLDTIDGITAFKRSLLEDLDSNLSGITSASLALMQETNSYYQDLADRMYDYAENKNKVNTEISAVKGYYVDGNGEPILNTKGEVIEVPQSAPMEPIFDKETGKLITFAMGEDGQIVASVQQVYQGDATATQSTIVSLLENGVSVQDILKYVPNADLDTVQKLASIVKTIGGGYDKYQWGGPSYTAVSDNDIAVALNEMDTSGTGGWCGAFVNQYLQKIGFAPSFVKDSLQSKLDIRNSTEPKVGSVVVFDYNHITPETGENNGHVGIVRGFKDGKMIVQDSNFNGDKQIKLREVSLDNPAIQGYFDPTIGVDEFNKGVQEETYKEQGLNKQGFNDTRAGYYDKYLAAKFTTEDWKQIGDKDKFEEEVENYKKYQESQVADVTINMLRALYDLKDMGWLDYQNASLGIPRTDGYAKRRDLQNFLSNTTLNKLIESKKSGATFGALSDAELGILQNAASILDWGLTRGDFNAEVNRLIEEMEQGLRDNGRSDLIAEISTLTGKREKVSGGNK